MIQELLPILTDLKEHLQQKAGILLSKYGSDSHLLGLLGNRNGEVVNFQVACTRDNLHPTLLTTYINNVKEEAKGIRSRIDSIEEDLLRNKPELRLMKTI